MVEPKDSISKEGNGYILPQYPSTSRAEESNGKSKFNIFKYLGLQGKTFWDWMHLLLGPVLFTGLLFLLGQHFEGQAKSREEYFNSERNKQEILRNYLTTMTGLISEVKLKDQLNDKNETQPTNQAAKALTQSTLKSFDKATSLSELKDVNKRDWTEKQKNDWEEVKLDADRKRQVLQFLNDAQLIKRKSPIINMEGIDLNGVNLSRFRLTPNMEEKQPPYIFINLKKANLNGSDLSGAQMEQADMTGIRLEKANLESADLKGADLTEANLEGAILKGANLEGADLTYANLTGADLTEANLSGLKNIHDAKLIRAKLRGAKLGGAKLWKAHLNGADLTDADFRNALGIETADMVEAKFCRTTMAEGTVQYPDCPRQAK